jgi:malonyl-CoA O-methyltransferase
MTLARLSKPVLEYRAKILARLAFHLGSGERILEVGTGMGYDAVEFARRYRRVVALDFEPDPRAWSELASERVAFVAGDAEGLPFADDSFDCVFEKDALHHFTRPEAAVAEFRRVTRSGGRCHFLESNRYNPVSYVHMRLIEGHDHFTRSRLVGLVSGAGRIETVEPFEAHVWPVGSRALRAALRGVESFFENTPLARPFLSYNYAVVVVD